MFILVKKVKMQRHKQYPSIYETDDPVWTSHHSELKLQEWFLPLAKFDCKPSHQDFYILKDTEKTSRFSGFWNIRVTQNLNLIETLWRKISTTWLLSNIICNIFPIAKFNRLKTLFTESHVIVITNFFDNTSRQVVKVRNNNYWCTPGNPVNFKENNHSKILKHDTNSNQNIKWSVASIVFKI